MTESDFFKDGQQELSKHGAHIPPLQPVPKSPASSPNSEGSGNNEKSRGESSGK